MGLTKVTIPDMVEGNLPFNRINGAPANVLDYGADPTGVADSTTAINNCITANGATFIPFGTYRCDGTIVIQSAYNAQKIVTMDGATLIRKTSGSVATTPVVQLLGSYGVFDAGGGFIKSENDSPSGVVTLGHANHTSSNYNAIYWSFKNAEILGNVTLATAGSFTAFQSVGVYVPSSQPNLGSSYVNYFGTMQNVHCSGVTTGLWMTDLANGHTFYNYRTRGFSHFGILLEGAYGNTIYGGFMEINYLDSKIGIKLGTKLYPTAPYASTLQSSHNQIAGFNMEFSGSAMIGLDIEALCQSNNVTFNWNAIGTAIRDNDGFNNIIESRQQRFTKVGTDTLTGLGAATQTVDIFPYAAGYTTTGYGVTVSAGQGFYPKADNTTPLGLVSKRWSVVYAGTGTINTSDENEKTDIEPLDYKEKAVALAIKARIKKFKFKDAVESKGDKARIHVGVLAQDVKAAFESEGLNPDDYGVFCSDTLENGSVRLGVRYDELYAFILGAI